MTGIVDRYFGFSGRLSRGQYWTRTLRLLIAFAAALAVFIIAITKLFPVEVPLIAKAIGGLVVGLFYLSALSITVRRLHDRRKSGWWIFPLYILPQLALSLVDPRQDPVIVLSVVAVASILSIWGLVEIGFMRGRREPNAYGPDPLDRP